MLEKVREVTRKRCNLIQGVYNFKESHIDETVERIFSIGLESVPSFRIKYSEVRRRVEGSMIEYFNRYAYRNCGFTIKSKSLRSWLKEALTRWLDTESRQLFENAFHGLHKLHTKIRMNYQNKNVLLVKNTRSYT